MSTPQAPPHSPGPLLPAPGAPRRGPLPWLRSLFARLNFRAKFLLVGAMLAGPLCVLAGFAAAEFHNKLLQSEARIDALHKGDTVRKLVSQLATHRGLSASVLAGGEELSSRLVAQQALVRRHLQAALEAFRSSPWPEAALPDPERLAREVQALLALPEAMEPARNFERHSLLIDQLLSIVYRTGTRGAGANGAAQAGVYDAGFVTLPLLTEDLGRQRGWGSAVLTERGYTEPEINRHLMFAGAVAQRLAFLRADARSLREIESLLAAAAGTGPRRPRLDDALTEAEVASQRSIAQVLARPQSASAAAEHFAELSTAIDQIAAIDDLLRSLLLARSEHVVREATLGRNAALALLVLVLVLLALVYHGFERSTVMRLRQLQHDSGRLAQGEFEHAVGIDGSDEIAQLAESIDTMRLRLREAVQESAAALAARESERERSEFLARWSHDLRTPLAAVLGFARLIAERDARGEGRLSPAQQADLQRIHTASEHLLQLVNDVLDVTSTGLRPLVLHSERVDVAAVVADAADLTANEALRRGVRLEVEPAPLPPGAAAQAVLARADRTRVLQVLGNLVGNAIKFNRPHGRVRVVFGPEPAQAGGAGTPWVRIDVHDQGEGIASADLGRLFKPFERLDAAARGVEGTGLGLATARRLADAMGGRIEVRTQAGAGSCFSLLLPAWAAAGAAGDAAAAPARLAGRVAYVEDNEANAELMRAMMETRSDVRLVVFASGAEALARPETFDLWVVDHQLPDTDGLSLLPRLRECHGEPLKAVLFTADVSPSLHAAARAAGFRACWTKPMAIEALESALQELLPPR